MYGSLKVTVQLVLNAGQLLEFSAKLLFATSEINFSKGVTSTFFRIVVKDILHNCKSHLYDITEKCMETKGRFISESVVHLSNCQTNMPNHYLKLEFLKLHFKELFFSVTGSQLS